MKKLAVVAVVLLVGVSAAPLAAIQPSQVEIFVDRGGVGTFEFEADGAAVEAGLVCPTGDAVILEPRPLGIGLARGGIVDVTRFVCFESSGDSLLGSFTVIFRRSGSTFTWRVIEGTDAYAQFRGHGKGVTIVPVDALPDGTVDLMVGKVMTKPARVRG